MKNQRMTRNHIVVTGGIQDATMMMMMNQVQEERPLEEEEVEPTAAVAGSAVPPLVTPTEEPRHRDREQQHSTCTAQGGPSTGSI